MIVPSWFSDALGAPRAQASPVLDPYGPPKVPVSPMRAGAFVCDQTSGLCRVDPALDLKPSDLVRAIQRALNLHSVVTPKIPVDGDLGPRTVAAIHKVMRAGWMRAGAVPDEAAIAMASATAVAQKLLGTLQRVQREPHSAPRVTTRALP